jgi:hypothetical protein
MHILHIKLQRPAWLLTSCPAPDCWIDSMKDGSVKPDNAWELLEQPEVDGAPIGGASLKADDFAAVAMEAQGASP